MNLRPGSTRGWIVRWLAAGLLAAVLGSAWAAPPAETGGGIDWTRARQHWAFRPPQPHPAPAVRHKQWPRAPIDRFLLARLEQRGLSPSPPADPRALLRRVTFDLTGLPPTPEEAATFLADHQPGAYERLVERLLASPRFGERLASMWLPLARYAEDQAHQVGSDTKFFYPNAHLYRQWVIDAFNHDLPYDRFVRLQLAADLVAGTAGNPGEGGSEPGPRALQLAQAPSPPAPPPPPGPGAAASPDLAALGFLGLGPKYYNRNRPEVMADEWQDRVDTVTRTFQGLTVACARCHDHKFDPITSQDYYALAGIFASTKMVNRTPGGEVEAASTEAAKMRPETMHVVADDTPHDVNLLIRGSIENKGPLVPRRFLRVLSDGEPTPFQSGSGRRELAEQIAARGNPLTARVMVNRLWGLVFGRGLVGTPSNFGLAGDRPTHPELLDDLAVRFMDHGWSVKSVVRELVRSSAYRQASGVGSVERMGNAAPRAAPGRAARPPRGGPPAPQALDPANTLLGRMPRRRLTVEQWRDSALFVSGLLETGGGPSQELADAANHRRTVYARVSRLKLDDLLMQFDYPDANVHAENRAVTTTPIQKLFVLNSPFVLEQARALAARLAREVPAGGAARVQRAYLLLYSRPPSTAETRLGVAYLEKSEADGMSRWERYAQVLLAANEMLYVD
jgi:hypothetical protein